MSFTLLRNSSVLIVLFIGGHSSADPLSHWKNLLHYHKDKSLIRNNEFFLHPDGNTDYEAELQETVDLINSENGETVACNYPARYSWLKSQGYPVRYIDLNACSKLSEFMRGFQGQRLSLVFASENIDSAESAFGHLLLVFRDLDNPPESADTIQFAAETEKDRFLRYAYKGITGGYPGYFVRSPLFVITTQYSVVEQRSLHFFDLDLTQDQIRILIYHLYELRKARFDYFFLKRNCAFQIASLLKIADENLTRCESAFVLPFDILDTIEDRITNAYTIEPSIMRGQRIIDLMRPSERRELRSANRRDIDPNEVESDRVKEVLVLRHEYMFRRHAKVLPDYDTVLGLEYSSTQSFANKSSLKEKSLRNRTGVGYYHSHLASGLYLQYSPLGRFAFENQIESFHENQFIILNTELVVDQDENIYLHRLDILSARSMFDKSDLSPNLSWDFDLGINRENSKNEASFNCSYGIGKAYATGKFGAAYLVGIGAQDSTSEGVFYVKPSIDLIYYPRKDLKIYTSTFSKIGIDGLYNQASFSGEKEFRDVAILVKYLTADNIAGDIGIVSLRFSF